MRGLVVLLVATLAACGRLGFQDRTATGDGDSDSVDPTGDGGTRDGQLPTTGWTKIAAGDESTCGIYKSRAYCWGRGTNNEIGDGVATNRNSPTLVALPAGTVTDISQGEGNACAIVDMAAYCWGNNAIGNGSPQSAMPAAVSLPATVTSISAGGQFACAIANGSVYCWGQDPGGALGNGAAGATLTPSLVTLPTTATRLDAGNDHVMALLSDGSLSVWGHNDSGCYGTGSTSPTNSDVPVSTPVVTGVLPSLAGWHACALVAGHAYCWGMGTHGELGNGMSQDSSTAITPNGMGMGVSVIAAGGGPSNFDAVCAAKSGVVSCWGAGIYGRLGTGNANNQPAPQLVQNLPADVVDLALGFEHSCALSSDGSLRCWGRGDLGQLGNGMGMNSLAPVVVPLPP